MFSFLCFRKSARPPFDKVTEGILFLVRHLLLTLSRNRPRYTVCWCALFDSAVVISGKPCCSVLQAKQFGTTSSSYLTVIGRDMCIQEASHVFTVPKKTAMLSHRCTVFFMYIFLFLPLLFLSLLPLSPTFLVIISFLLIHLSLDR